VQLITGSTRRHWAPRYTCTLNCKNASLRPDRTGTYKEGWGERGNHREFYSSDRSKAESTVHYSVQYKRRLLTTVLVKGKSTIVWKSISYRYRWHNDNCNINRVCIMPWLRSWNRNSC